MLHHHPRPDGRIDVRGASNLLYLLANSYSTCFTVFIRRNFGSEALGLNAIVALAVMVTCMAMHPESVGMRLFVTLWLVMLVVQRLNSTLAQGRGEIWHSRSGGYPWFGFAFPFVRRDRTARQIEGLACFIGGGMLCQYDMVLGRFILCGFFSLLVKNGIEMEIDRKLVQRMHDAEIEQRHLVDLRHHRD